MKNVFIAYAPEDDALYKKLETHLSMLKRGGHIDSWSDQRISVGAVWTDERSQLLKRADIILLLISADFLASDFLYHNDLRQALVRHHEGTARVIPVILRECLWETGALSSLKPAPDGGNPVTGHVWSSLDAGFENVATGLMRVLKDRKESSSLPISAPEPPRAIAKKTHPRWLTLVLGGVILLQGIALVILWNARERTPSDGAPGLAGDTTHPAMVARPSSKRIDLPAGQEATIPERGVTYKVLSAYVEPVSLDQVVIHFTVRCKVAATEVGINFWNASLRFDVGDGLRYEPSNDDVNEVVKGDSFKEAEFIFKLPSRIKQGTLFTHGAAVAGYHWK